MDHLQVLASVFPTYLIQLPGTTDLSAKSRPRIESLKGAEGIYGVGEHILTEAEVGAPPERER